MTLQNIVNDLGEINLNEILNEVKFLLTPEISNSYKKIEEDWPLDKSNNVFLQKGKDPTFDLPNLNYLFAKFNMSTSRLMCLHPQTCYTIHTDVSPRIHFPLITSDKCLFVVNDEVYRLNAGRAYCVDTTKTHTALNGEKELLRYHIVGLVNEMV